MIAPLFSASHSAKWEGGTLQHDDEGHALAGPSTPSTSASNRPIHTRYASEPTWTLGGSSAGARREGKRRRTRFGVQGELDSSPSPSPLGKNLEPSGPTARVELGAAFASRLSQYHIASPLLTPQQDVYDEWGGQEGKHDDEGFRWEKAPAGTVASAMPGEGGGVCRCGCHTLANGKGESGTRE
ncbi:hypothetical protein CONPUDRAFT_158584 [Coniophora puteana RWD-64-598 SS2]|uniref:Uncharacterized protein n=1 Tax=Coniophora puteana (strain RWD-64-598) TaxID=741705 RepID=A0A5M3MA26_CONPW|nr:uncharacterized protein CONPUDRAFT_158584 [Coniophora puteana RWD-64-598 SS2]EIW75796.1 hypothetical protein CONPUDRAFT_158584 [Coniophora puteana RWD-64-598 SS2]